MLSESEASEATTPRKGKYGCFALAQHDMHWSILDTLVQYKKLGAQVCRLRPQWMLLRDLMTAQVRHREEDKDDHLHTTKGMEYSEVSVMCTNETQLRCTVVIL
jgi:hypothetical protein